MTTPAELTALASFPQLRGLRDLRAAGWLFIPVTDGGDLVELRGVKVWPPGWADALLLRDLDDAAALRVDPAGGLVWQRDGSLSEVVDGLLTLPPPDARHAPRLVSGSAPRLWTP